MPVGTPKSLWGATLQGKASIGDRYTVKTKSGRTWEELVAYIVSYDGTESVVMGIDVDEDQPAPAPEPPPRKRQNGKAPTPPATPIAAPNTITLTRDQAEALGLRLNF